MHFLIYNKLINYNKFKSYETHLRCLTILISISYKVITFIQKINKYELSNFKNQSFNNFYVFKDIFEIISLPIR